MIGKKKNKKMGRSKGVENDNPNKNGKKQSKSKKTASSNILKDESVCGDDIFSAPLKKRVEKKEEEKSGEKQWEITLDPEIKTIQQKKATKGKKNKRKSIEEEQMWSKSQEQQLILALSDSKPSDKDFWKKVSAKVGKSTSECISKYQQLYPSPSKKKRKSSTKKKVEEEKAEVKSEFVVKGNVGTVKRKRHLRELITESNQDYADTIQFEDAPDKEGSLFDISCEEIAVNSIYIESEGENGAKSGDEVLADVDRTELDMYINRLNKKTRSRKARQKVIEHNSVKSEIVANEALHSKIGELVSEAEKEKKKQFELDNEDDSEKDYYFEEN